MCEQQVVRPEIESRGAEWEWQVWRLYDGVRGRGEGGSDAHAVTQREVKVGRTCVKCDWCCFVIFIDKELII